VDGHEWLDRSSGDLAQSHRNHQADHVVVGAPFPASSSVEVSFPTGLCTYSSINVRYRRGFNPGQAEMRDGLDQGRLQPVIIRVVMSTTLANHPRMLYIYQLMILLMAIKSPGPVWFAPMNAVRPDILHPPHVNSKIQPVSVRALENYCTVSVDMHRPQKCQQPLDNPKAMMISWTIVDDLRLKILSFAGTHVRYYDLTAALTAGEKN
jgi:hypothetical protein